MASSEKNDPKTCKDRVMRKVAERQLCSMMNDTKWKELQGAMATLPFPPPYQIKFVCEETATPSTFDADVTFWGDWGNECLLPFYGIEWILVRPRYARHRGKLVSDEIVDETQEFVSVLAKFSIPYMEKDGAYIIYGYR